MGCSSVFGQTHFLNLRNVVIPKASRFNVMISDIQSLSGVGCQYGYRYEKKRSLLVVSLLKPEGEPHSVGKVRTVAKESHRSPIGKDAEILQNNHLPSNNTESDNGGGGELFGGGGDGNFSGGRGGGGGGSDNGGNDEEEKEFGPLLTFEEVVRETEARGASLPSDMLEAAKSVGIRKLLLLRYLELQV